jgi:quercetin dioxygenase-like cupin family protein/uncharacterized protein YndB with AHSA1/START domain
MTADVHASVMTKVNPEVAFAIFTDEIDRWWRPGPDFSVDAHRAVGWRIERGVGGSWLEFYDDLGDDAVAIGEITTWEPGERIAFRSDRQALPVDASVAVRFVPAGTGTRVEVTHDGLDEIRQPRDPDAVTSASNGWDTILSWFQEWADWGSPLRLAARPAGRGYVLQRGDGVVAGDPSLKASRRSTAGSMTVIESRTMGGAPLHVHAFDDEIFYVLDGVMTVGMDGVTHEIGAGGVAFIPRGLPHEWDTIGEATVLIITSPGGIEEFLHALHTSPDPYPETWARIGPRYGYTML